MNIKLVAIMGVGLLIGALSAISLIPAARTALFPGHQLQSSGKALIGGPFELIDHHGNTVTDKTYRGKYTLVYFGFTFCPDICPASLQVISSALDDLGKSAEKITPLFITVDPERDTPAKMADYVGSFNKSIVGLTGSPQQIQAAARAYRIYYAKVNDEDYPGDYTMDHSSYYYLMSPTGEFITHFRHTISAPKLRTALAKVL